MATNKRFKVKNGLDNGGYSITGVGSSASTLDLAGNFTTSGANALTLTTTGTTSATLPSGTVTLAKVSGETLTNLTLSGTLTAGGGTGTSGQFLKSTASGVEWATIPAADVTASGNNAFTGANTFTNSTGQIFRNASTQDGILLKGRVGGTGSYTVEIVPAALTNSRTLTLADGDTTLQAGTMAVTGGTLGQFASTTSAQLAGVISDETGTGSLVFANSPSLVTPTIGGGGANFSGATSGSINVVATGTAGSNTLTLPAVTGTVITSGDTGTVTNTMLAGSIANNKLVNSSVTVNGTSISLGSSGTITAASPNALTIGTGLSGTSYNGSAAVTIAIDSTVATLTGTQTLQNKSIHSGGVKFLGATSGDITVQATSTAGTNTLTLPAATGTVALTNNKLSAFAATTSAELAGVISDETGTGALVFAGSPTFTGTANFAAVSTSGNLTVGGDLLVQGDTVTVNVGTILVEDKNIELGSVTTPTNTTADGGGITLKGATDKTFNWINSTGAWTSSEHVALAGGKNILLNGATSGTITLSVPAAAGTGTITLPASTTGTVITTGDTGTVTNTMLAGSIANNKLANSSITVNGSSISLGGSATITAASPNALTIGTGLSGTSYNGSAAVTIAIDSTVATLTGIQTLTNKTLTLPTIGGTGAKFSGSTSGDITVIAAATAGTNTLTLPAVTGNIVTTGDTGTVTNTMLAGSIANAKLANSSITINGSAISLGGSVSNLAVTTGKLSQFAATTSSELAGVISDETGSGALVFATSPTLVTPTIGVATATSVGFANALVKSVTATLTGTAQTLDSFDKTAYRGAKYLIIAKSGTGATASFHLTELLVIADDAASPNAYITEYGIVSTADLFTDLDATVASDTVSVKVTPTNAGTVFKVMAQYIAA